jgi:hypothetical protein
MQDARYRETEAPHPIGCSFTSVGSKSCCQVAPSWQISELREVVLALALEGTRVALRGVQRLGGRGVRPTGQRVR